MMTSLSVYGPAILVVAGLYTFFRKNPPEWVHELSTSWNKVLTVATMSSVVSMVLSGLAFHDKSTYLMVSSVMVMSLLTLLTIVSMATDWQVRKVDRRLLRMAIVVAGLINAPTIYQTTPQTQTLWMIVVLAVSLLFFSSGVGASDVRALLFVVIGVLPLIGFNIFVMSIWVLIAIFMVYTLIEYVHRNKSIRGYLTSKSNSVPMVPLILIPYVFILPLS